MFAKAFNINVLQGKVKGVTLRHREKPLNLIIGFMKKTMLTLGGLFCVALLSAQEYQKTDHGIRTTVNGVDVDCQILHMELLAGDRYDCAVRVKEKVTYGSDPLL